MSKEINNDRRSFSGTAVDDHRAASQGEYRHDQHSRRLALARRPDRNKYLRVHRRRSRPVPRFEQGTGSSGRAVSRHAVDCAHRGKDRQIHGCTGFSSGTSHRPRQGLSAAGSGERSLYGHRQRISVDVSCLRTRCCGDRCASTLRGAYSAGDRGSERQADHAHYLQPFPRRSYRRHEVSGWPSRHHRAGRNRPAASTICGSEPAATHGHLRRQVHSARRNPSA